VTKATRKTPTKRTARSGRRKTARKPTKQTPTDEEKQAPAAAFERVFEPALCLVGEGIDDVWGMPTAERLKRQFARNGVSEVLSLEEAVRRNGPVILVRADAVIDQPLIPVLVKRPNLALAEGSGEAAVMLAIAIDGSLAEAAAQVMMSGGLPGDELKLLVRAPADLDSAFWKGLRKRQVPYAMRVDTGNRKPVEWRMFMATYKGATDLVTKHLWPRPAYHVTRRLAGTSVTPNMVTTLGAVCVALAFALFLQGHFIAGLIAAWLMTFLDTVDGKLARTTLASSKWGDIFDHGIDLIHPPFWYIAWGYGLAAAGMQWSSSFLWLVLAAVLIGYVLQRLIEGAAIKWLGLEIHIWRPIDTFFRQITARRNPNLVILTLAAIVGRPDWGLVAVAAWTVICLVLHGVQIAQAFAALRSGGPLRSWMNTPQSTK
jgi:phosphatidylglycerophosphate synthase